MSAVLGTDPGESLEDNIRRASRRSDAPDNADPHRVYVYADPSDPTRTAAEVSLDNGTAWPEYGDADLTSALGEEGLNPLDDYISVSYHLNLQMMPHPGGDATYYSLAESTDGVTFASTGGQFDGTSSFFKIESFSMRTVEGVTATNPEIALVVESKLKLSEPHGLSFDKRMREKAAELGYDGGLPTRIIWRMDVGFSGYNPSTGEWKSRIPIVNKWTGSASEKISYFFNFTNLDSTVSFMGTDYEINMVPYMQTALRPEDIYLDAANLRSDPSHTIESFLSDFEEALNRESHRIYDENGGTKYTYEIQLADVPKNLPNSYAAALDIRGETFEFDALADRHNLLTSRPTRQGDGGSAEEGGTVIHVGGSTSVPWIIMQSLRALPKVQSAFMRENDSTRTSPRATFIVRPEIDYDTATRSSVSNDFEEITLRYVIEPYLDWRFTFNDNSVQLNETYQRQRLQSVLDMKALRRVYNYMYQPDNSEIIDLDVKYKYFFYEELSKIEDEGSIHNAGVSVAATNEELAEDRNEPNETADRGGSNSSPEPHNSGSINVTGTESLSIRRPSPAQIDNEQPGERYDRAFENMLRNDLLTLEGMKVRGDPQWLYVRNFHALNYAGTANIIRLNMYAPEQDQYMNPNSSVAQRNQSIGGFFEILQVEHTFEGGSYEQVLSGYKLRGFAS